MKLKHSMLLVTLGIGLVSCGQDEKKKETPYTAKPTSPGSGESVDSSVWCNKPPVPTPPPSPTPVPPPVPTPKPEPTPVPPPSPTPVPPPTPTPCPKCPDQKPCPPNPPCPPCQKCPDQKPTPPDQKPDEPTPPEQKPTPPDQKPDEPTPPSQKPPTQVTVTPCPCTNGQTVGWWMDVYGGWHMYAGVVRPMPPVAVPNGWWMSPDGVWHPYTVG